MTLDTLILDDSEVMRGMIAKALKEGGVPLGKIYHASNGVEGLTTLRSHTIDLIMVDLGMPILGGEGFLNALRSEISTSKTAVVVVTSRDRARAFKALEGLPGSYLRKPFTPNAVWDAVSAALEICQ